MIRELVLTGNNLCETVQHNIGLENCIRENWGVILHLNG